jgi:uncharacterized protein (TIGR03083 family)
MEVKEHIAYLREHGYRLEQAVRAAGLESGVPTCPQWSARDLIVHVGGVHRWATSHLVGDARAKDDEGEESSRAALDGEELLAWYAHGLSTLVTTPEGADPQLECWTFLSAASPLAFWARRQAHETSMHCVDAAATAGWETSFPGAFAVDGIDELLNGSLARPQGQLVADPPVSFAIESADTEDAWTIHIVQDRWITSPGLEDADCFLRGGASDLYLLLWNRRSVGPDMELRGDPAVLDLWRSGAVIRWR